MPERLLNFWHLRCGIFQGCGVYSRVAFIANLETTTVNFLCHLNVFAEVLARELSSKAVNYSLFELNNITIEKNKFPRLVKIECCLLFLNIGT